MGGGPLTSRITAFLWGKLLKFHFRKPSHKLLSIAGLILVVITFVVWTALIWLGWGLIFNASTGAVLNANTLIPADFLTRFYYTGFTIITLGIGDYIPGSHFFQLLTVLASVNGFVFFTLVISYLLPLISAVIEKRALAAYISNLGHSPDEIICSAWNGKDFGGLAQHFSSLAPMLINHGQQQLAYPVLHTFYSPNRETAIGPGLATLDEALSVIEFGLQVHHHPDKSIFYTLRQSISMLLATQDFKLVEDDLKVPPLPDLQKYRSMGMDVINTPLFEKHLAELEKRRQYLQAFVRRDGWDWNQTTFSEKRSYESVTKDPKILLKSDKGFLSSKEE